MVAAALLGVPAARAQSPAPQSQPQVTQPAALDAKRARKAYEKGRTAEKVEDWRAAFERYAEAAAHAPLSAEYLLRREAARFRLVQQHVDLAEREALVGRLEEARNELRAALELDPGYSVARERFEQLQSPPAQEPPRPPEYEVGPVRLRPQPGTRSFDFSGTTRGAYEDVARKFGLMATFDEDLRARQIRFRVADLNFETAMRLLGQQTGTFWRAVDERTFLVVEDTPQKQREYAPSVVRTIVLPSATTPDRMTEILRIVREMVGTTRALLDTRTRTLTIRDTPEGVALALGLVKELEQARGELMLEVHVLEVDRALARKLGITPPSSARILTISPSDVDEALQSQQALLRVLLRVFGTSGSLTGLSGDQIASLIASGQLGAGALVPPLVIFGGGRTRFVATLPGAAVDFAETLSLLRSARRMLLRAEDGQPATFFIGERFPINLAAFSASLVTPTQLAGASERAFTRTDFVTGDAPVSVATADLNDDDRLDLVTANENSNTLSILLGNADGTFAAMTELATGALPRSVVTADFNGDTRADLAVANAGADTVSIFLGNGDGTFGTGTNFATGDGPRSLATGDFNGDNRLDLAVANEDADTVSILLGNGDGTFGPGTDFPADDGPRSVTTGDFNGDNRLDLAVANQNSDTASVFLGNGDGTFSSRTDLAAGDAPFAVATGNFNADSFLDLVVTNEASDTVSVFLGNGDGTFSTRTDLAVGDGPSAVVVGDFSGDGRPDVAVANMAADTVSVLLGNGDGTFGVRLDLATGDAPSAAVTGDFNADGRLDLALSNREADTLSVILNTILAAAVAQPGGVLQSPYPGFQYEDLGLKVRATPRLHPQNEVTLQLQIEIRSRTGASLNGIPVISNRTIEQTVRLREDEMTVMAGILQREERLGLEGWPGVSRAPVAGYLVGRRDTDKRETELLIVITPRRIRLAPRADRSFYAGREPRGAVGGAAQQPPP